MEVAVVGVIAYVSFLLAEALHLSGILSLFVCALVISHYALCRLSRPARATMLHAFNTLALVAEQLIFIYCGLAALDRAAWTIARPGLVLSLVAVVGCLLLAARAVAVAAALALSNWMAAPGAPRISAAEALVVWWAGCMRGAVSVAIAAHHFAVVAPGANRTPLAPPAPGSTEEEQMRTHASVIAAAFLVVLISTILFSSLTRPFLALVLPAAMAGSPHPPSPCDADAMQDADAPPEDGAAASWLHRTWAAADARYLAPLLGSTWEASAAAARDEHQRGAYTELLSRF